MTIGTILFTYNRSSHTKKVLEGLAGNTVIPQKLYIFQDGLSKEEHRKEWEKVTALIREVNFCRTEVHVSEENKGCAASIVAGMDYVLNREDAAIVLEDDCVPSISFMRFMMQNLTKYQSDKRVFEIGGCSWPVQLSKGEYDVYGCRRTCSSGWATWKDRWSGFSYDAKVLRRLKNDREGSRTLAVWGRDCESMLLGDVAGLIDAWDIYWTLHVMEMNGICLCPYESFISNIGFDGSGLHSGTSDIFKVEVSDKVYDVFSLPDEVNVTCDVERAFLDLYGCHSAFNEKKPDKEQVIIYGMGRFFRQYEEEISEKYYMSAFVDRACRGYYAGKDIIDISEIPDQEFDKIVIMIKNPDECRRIADEIMKTGVDGNKIVFGLDLFVLGKPSDIRV